MSVSVVNMTLNLLTFCQEKNITDYSFKIEIKKNKITYFFVNFSYKKCFIEIDFINEVSYCDFEILVSKKIKYCLTKKKESEENERKKESAS